VLDDRADGHGSAGLDVGRDLLQLREVLLVDALDEHIHDAAARQPDGEGVVVAHPVPFQRGHAVGHHLLRRLVDRALDAAAGHAADRLSAGPHEHRRPRGPRGRPPGRDDGAHPDALALPPPGEQLVHHLTHRTAPP
jgi:hypothetical protein